MCTGVQGIKLIFLKIIFSKSDKFISILPNIWSRKKREKKKVTHKYILKKILY